MWNRLRFLLRAIVQEWRFMVRQPALLLALLAIPVVYPLIVSYLYQANQVVERPAVVVDDDNSALSRELVLALDATQELSVTQRYDSIDKGWQALREGQAEVLVYVPGNLSTRVKRGEQAHVKLWVNSANMLTYGVAYPGVSNVVSALNEELGQEYFYRKGMSTAAAAVRTAPLVRAERLAFHPTLAYGDFFVPGLLVIVLQQAVMIGLALSVGLRREAEGPGCTVRWPFTELEGRFLAQVLVYLAGAAFLVWVVFPYFGWSLQNSWALFVLFGLFLIVLAPIAVLVASLMKDRYEAFQVLMFASAPLFLMSGFSWPLDQMPGYVQVLAWVFPSTPVLGAVRLLTMKTGDLQAVLPQCRVLGIQFLVYLALAVLVVRLRAKRGRTRDAVALQAAQ